jgi:hypothetical protein
VLITVEILFTTLDVISVVNSISTVISTEFSQIH